MSESKGYNGWANYETWLVALHIDNDAGTYERRRGMAEEARTGERIAACALADALKGWVTDELVPQLENGLGADLLGAALSEVDWYEIAENFLEEE